MSEPRFETVTGPLRAAAPEAPERLRQQIRVLAAEPRPASRRLWFVVSLKRSLALGVAAFIGFTLLLVGLRSLPEQDNSSIRVPARALSTPHGSFQGSGEKTFDQARLQPFVPGSRLQDYRAQFRVRVRDLSAATKSAIRTTRRLDGYVAGADYSTGASTGDSSLDLRVPVQRVQDAIASFSQLGTILSQRIAVSDLQAGADQLDRQIDAARKRHQTQVLERLLRRRTALVHQGAYAKITLSLTTRKAAAHHAQPGRFDRFWGDAGDILGKEAIIVLYALVVAGPFLLLAALALLGERARRRRADTRLLEETG